MNVSLRLSNSKHRKHVIARAIACSFMLLFLPSCGIPPIRKPEPPGSDLPTTFNGATSSENSSQLGIEEFYDDTRLTFLIEQALTGNRELKVLNEDVQIAGNEVLRLYQRTFPSSFSAPLDEQGQPLHGDWSRHTRRPVSPRPVLSAAFGVSTSPGSWTYTGSCGMPGTRQGSVSTSPSRGGTTSSPVWSPMSPRIITG